MFDARENFAHDTVLTPPSPTTSGTSLILNSASEFADPAVRGRYKIVVKANGQQPNSSNSEICIVTAKSSNTLTIIRAQESTVARDIQVGDEVYMAMTADAIGDLSQANWFHITQTAHGFAVGNAIYHNGTNWQKAKADAIATLGTHIVTFVPGANYFFASQIGRCYVPSHGLTIGEFYYVSDVTAGALTTTEPTTYSNPLVYVESADYLHVLPFRASAGSGFGSVPIGAVFPFAGAVVPGGYLLADGSAVSRTTYSDLFNLIGTTFGSGDGSTTFNLPNLKGKVPVGVNASETEFDTLGEIGGAKTHTLLDAEIPKHRHPFNGAGSNLYNETQSVGTGANSRNLVMLTSTAFQNGVVGDQATGDGAHNNLQPYIALHYVIKAFTPSETTATVASGGWNEIVASVTRQSADDPTYVLRFNTDVTGILSVGMRIKITQATDKFFIITAIGSFTGGNTDVTCYGGTDYDVVDTGTTAITKTYYSRDKAPKGFPLDPAKWSVTASSTSTASQSTPTQNTWYNLGSINIIIPIGVWNVDYSNLVYCGDSGTSTILDVEAQTTLSTANNSESDSDLTSGWRSYRSNLNENFTAMQLTKQKFLNLASKTTYYLNERTTKASMDVLSIRGDINKIIIKAVCAYL